VVRGRKRQRRSSTSRNSRSLACCNAIIQAGITRIYTQDKWYWNDDPFDGDHSRKRKILRQTHLKVEAPFHPEYIPHEPINPQKKKAPMRETNATPSSGKAAEGD
jgi:hypothetical protein